MHSLDFDFVHSRFRREIRNPEWFSGGGRPNTDADPGGGTILVRCPKLKLRVSYFDFRMIQDRQGFP
jgi:hypothetical protein